MLDTVFVKKSKISTAPAKFSLKGQALSILNLPQVEIEQPLKNHKP